MSHRSCAPHTDISQTRKYLNNMIASPNNGTLDFVLVLSSKIVADKASRVVGKAGISSLRSHSKPEIGFMLKCSYWGHGYMVEALDVLLPHLWRDGIQEILADVDPRNVGSIGLLKRFGFVEVKLEKNTVETHLGWCDSLCLELTRPQMFGAISERK